ncbi:class I SAM-dependent methyltransferase [Flavihumibacter solisilvae]|uniref:Methyltransferase type 11 n=1 Tax=Flavihumibacter solisilvae TaxID=1349421 RepID=A0A0C1LDK4_9BACT|nr:class I SAM-dependent methyltransferase [Flavihumibacter solisilvae]KIC93533.1 methyltransferase type 11 [Flavihumibacter solisilvae]
MEQNRRQFQGVLNILSFNRHYYVFGFAVLLSLFISRLFIEWPADVLWIIASAFIYGLLIPLFVSAYVYDFSGYYRFDWLKQVFQEWPEAGLIVNINAGFDETSFILKEKFPLSEIRVFDFYNSKRHTEPAIKRARKVSMIYPNTKTISSDSIPLQDKTVDVVFLLSAAHEIRSQEEKVMLLKECHRLCKPGGKVVMVEHLRDFPNFLAFSVGFTHFFSRTTWRHAFEAAGFSTFNETKFTPFMSIFNCSH